MALSVIRDDGDWYPTASRQFFDDMHRLAGHLGAAEIRTPLISLGKQSVIAEGVRLGLDFGTTYSCMVGGEIHCGGCHQCAARRVALLAAAVFEPPEFYRQP